MRSVSWLLLTVAAIGLAQEAPKPISVEGMVRNAITGSPISRAHVLVRTFGTGGTNVQNFGTMSDAAGKFIVKDLPAGGFYAYVEASGYTMPIQNYLNGASGTLAAGDKKAVELKLIPTGTISGRVLDEDGNPVMAEVTTDNGSSVVSTAGTDEKGQYRLSGVEPGKYRIKAKAASMILGGDAFGEQRADGSVATYDATTYYPGVRERAAGARVVVSSGLDQGGMDIRMVRAKPHFIRGMVAGAEGITNLQVMIPLPNGGTDRRAGVGPDKKWTMWKVEPGKIRLFAGGGRNGIYATSAPVELEVGDQDIDGVELKFVEPFEFSGHVIFEDAGAKPADKERAAAKVILTNTIGSGGFLPNMKEDDSFAVVNGLPNRYRAAVSWKNGYVKSVQVGSVANDGPYVDLRAVSGPTTVTVVVGSGMGEVSGSVTDTKGPVENAMVMLVEAELVLGTPVLRAKSGAGGTYKFSGVVPGKYRLYAADGDDKYIYGGNTDNYEDVSVDLEVRDKDRLTRDLKRHSK